MNPHRAAYLLLVALLVSLSGCKTTSSDPSPSETSVATGDETSSDLGTTSDEPSAEVADQDCEEAGGEADSQEEPEPATDEQPVDEAAPATCDLQYEDVKRQKVADFYRWPHRTCVEEHDGEQFCFWESVRAAVPLGKNFIEYGNCQVLSTQAPPWQRDVRPTDCDDPRLADAEWVAESNWVRDQIRSTSCQCCHDSTQTGYADSFDIAQGPLWVTQLTEMGILTFGGFKAVLSGRVKDRKAFIPPEENNGFSRDEGRLGFQTTDVQRLRAFFQQELDWRNITDDDIRNFDTIPIPEQLNIEEPVNPCPSNIGVDAAGVIHWAGTVEARYLYVMGLDAETPRPPPHFDYPEGTLWRIDRHHLEPVGFRTGEVTYGSLPAGSLQRQLAPGEQPPALVEGETYRLYGLMDMHSFNIVNCTFTYPIVR